MYEYHVKMERTAVSTDVVSFRNSSLAADLLINRFGMRDEAQEVFYLVSLDSNLNVIGYQLISRGSMTATPVDIPLLLRSALLTGAKTFIISHNHPAGDAYPSREDLSVTGKIKEAFQLLGLQIADHIIISPESSYSFSEHGIL